MARRFLIAMMPIFSALSIGHSIAAAETPAARDVAIELRSFLQQHCVACHGLDVQESDLRLDTLSGDLLKPHVEETWTNVLARIAHGEMPPRSEPRPEVKSLEQTVIVLRRNLADAARRTAHLKPGRGPRRLNRAEYENSINALLGTDLPLAGLLPEDGLAEGFDKVGRALNISPVQVERYMEAADIALTEAMTVRPKVPHTARRYNLWDDSGIARRTFTKNGVWAENEDAVLAFYTNDKFFNVVTFNAPVRGKYRIRVSAYGTLMGEGAKRSKSPVQLAIHGGAFRTTNRVSHLVGFFSTRWEEPQVFEAVDLLEAGHSFKLTIAGQPPYTFYADEFIGPALAIQWFEIEGPLEDDMAKRQQALVYDGVDPRCGTQADAQRLLHQFAERAFRRPTTTVDVAPYQAVMDAQFAAGATFQAALKVGMKTILCAPEFLFVDRNAADVGLGQADDYAIASRLSYFLWSAPPDAELLETAKSGRLQIADERRRQVDRMLADGRASFFTRHFLDHWLDLKKIDFTTPDKELYPEFDEPLRDAMVRETRAFFDDLVQSDGSVLNFIDSDYAMLNERLARHYGIDGVRGDAIRKVSLPPDCVRGGALTQASVLKVTADGTVTSPVLRGVWLLDRVLGRPVPPPPPGIPGVEPDIRGARTIREQLATHRQSESCAGCHSRIDPPGFALESFDPIGGERETYRVVDPQKPGLMIDGKRVKYSHGRAVEAGDEMPDGRTFADVREFRRLLLAEPRPIAENVAAKLLTYALGRELDAADREEIRAIVERLEPQGFGLRSMIKELAAADVFVGR